MDNLLSKEFKTFYEDIVKSDKDFKFDRKRKEAEEKWEAEKKTKENSLVKKMNELKESEKKIAELEEITLKKKELKDQIGVLRNSIKSFQREDERYDASEENRELKALENEEKELRDYPKEQTKLEKSIKNQTNDVQRIEGEIREKYMHFKYAPKENEIKNTQKSNEKMYKQLKLPKYSLPEVGVLYETKKEYFLEIVDYDNLDKANELKQRYEDKEYKVVTGDNDE